jgi:hypothetical protein
MSNPVYPINIDSFLAQLNTTFNSNPNNSRLIEEYKRKVNELGLYIQNLSQNLIRYNISIDNIDIEKYKNNFIIIQSQLNDIKQEFDKLLN